MGGWWQAATEPRALQMVELLMGSQQIRVVLCPATPTFATDNELTSFQVRKQPPGGSNCQLNETSNGQCRTKQKAN